MIISDFAIKQTSIITRDNKQRVDIYYTASEDAHLYISVYKDAIPVFEKQPINICSGERYSTVFLPVCEEAFDAVWKITDDSGNVIVQTSSVWSRPREWNFYVMISSHTDIGLHNSQYIQRFNSVRFVDKAVELCDATKERDKENQYRYVMEGTWFWNNYGADKGEAAAKKIIDEYISQNKLGVCACVAGNHTQVYGLEELCRSTYPHRELKDKWNIDTKTMTMIDNNGISQSIISPYAEAGIENIIFAPNQWNPLPSTVWKTDTKIGGYTWNPNAGGGGARIDVSYSSALPMVFYWKACNSDSKLLVWCSTQYEWGGEAFGIFPDMDGYEDKFAAMEEAFAKQLGKLESKYPYDVWLLECYGDDQEPSLSLINAVEKWNKKYKCPKIQALGNPDEPFDKLREKFDEQIPVLSGEIICGWYQHPLTTPDLLARKSEADRALPTAEKLAVLAALTDKNFKYPKQEFERAWEQLLFNDEHSYGTSGYQGRKVYETWMQHRAWIENAECIAQKYTDKALECICGKIDAGEESVVIFNQTAQKRAERIEYKDMEFIALDIPPFGYKAVKRSEMQNCRTKSTESAKAPIIENEYYKLEFSDNGAIKSIYDKQLKKELLDGKRYANEFIYTNDNHKTFFSPVKAEFKIEKNACRTTVIAKMNEEKSGAEIMQKVTLPENEKRIEIDNKINHLSDMFNNSRYYRYAYYAFPIRVENCRRYCASNGGGVIEYAKSVTGHGTDVYMPVYEWCSAENDDFGIAVCQLDSQIAEFDHIHEDKTDYKNTGRGSQLYFYLANDWLQMHVPDGEHLNCRFRYVITSYEGDYKKAEIPQLAERIANPVLLYDIEKQAGTLNSDNHSFLALNKDIRFVNLKPADDGNGLIARFYGDASDLSFSLDTECGGNVEPCAVDEKEKKEKCGSKGLLTYRVGRDGIKIQEYQERSDNQTYIPKPIGSEYTGLIAEPRAACGEKQGQLYLLWGQNKEKDLAYYELYRSEKPDFETNEETFAAKVEPGEYCVARYEDTGLKKHTRYYYKVCAVNNKNIKGKMSEVFSGLTREECDE